MLSPISDNSLEIMIKSAIVKNPLVVSPEQKVSEAIAQMGNVDSLCSTTQTDNDNMDSLHRQARASCVVVIEEAKVVGILTERDIVGLSIQKPNLDVLVMREAMTSPVLTVRESELSNLFSIINFIQQHHIRHLPVLDDQDQLVGILTHSSLRQSSQAFELMQLRRVAEVMTDQVVSAKTDCSLLKIAQKMFKHKVSSVIIVESNNQKTSAISADANFLTPMGIITEGDIVQFQALGLRLADYRVEIVMSTPVFAVHPEDSLWSVQQLMERKNISRVIVTGQQSQLLGVVTATSLLKAINPVEIYKLAEVLQSKVVSLEAEKVALLESRSSKLETEVKTLKSELQEEFVYRQKVEERLQATDSLLLKRNKNILSPKKSILVQIHKKLQSAKAKDKIDNDQIEVVVVEDNPDDVDMIEQFLTKAGFFNVMFFSLLETALTHLQNHKPDVVILNLHLPDSQGLATLQAVELAAPTVAIIVLISLNSHNLALAAIHQGSQDYLVKGKISQDNLVRSINYAIYQKNLLQQLQHLFDNAKNLIHRVRIEDGKFEYVNKSWQETLGYSSTEVPTLTIFDILHPSCYKLWLNLMNKIQQGIAETDSIELRFISKNQKEIIVEGNIAFEPNNYPKISRCIFRDITEDKVIESERRQLIQELSKFKKALDQSAICAITDAKGIITYTNDKFCEISGYSRSELLGKTHKVVNSGFHSVSFFQNLWQTITKGKVWQGDICNRAKNGNLYWVYSTITPFLNDRGKPYQYLAIRFDITEKKQAEAEIAQQLASIQAAVDGTASIKNDFYQDVNPSYIEMFDYESQEELVGKSRKIIHSAEELEKFDREFFQLLKQNHSWQGEITALRKDGSILTEEISLTFLENDLIICVCQDVTERKQAELALQRYSREVEDLYNKAPCGYHSLDAAGTYVRINDTELKWLGYTRSEVLGKKKFLDFLTPESQKVFWENFNKFKTQSSVDRVEYQIITGDGSIRWFSVNAIAIKDDAGNLIMTRSTMFDISLNKAAEAKLQHTNAKLARATKLKDEFLANMSHELRTPLNAILGMTETLQEQVYGEVNERQQDALKIIAKSGKHLLQLISDILDLSKIESKQVILNCQPIKIKKLCQDSLIFIKQQAFKKRIQTHLKIPSSLPELIVDERRICQVLINLLNNAVKFTPEEGSITLQVTTVEAETNPENLSSTEASANNSQTWIRFSVIDTGIGISQENIEKLFQPFVQVDSALNRQYSGTGLGLSVVKKIIELHGGKSGVTSKEGAGSHFWFDLPCDNLLFKSTPNLSRDSLASTQETSNSPFTPCRILLAEDNLSNIKTISGYLAVKGYQVITAHDGEEAINMAKSEHPDLILMDIQMPKLDGLEAMKQIRQDSAIKDIPIIALTALVMPGDRKKCLDAGATDYLSKPIRLRQLTTMIEKIVSNSSEDG
ncbi:MAG: PAS domain S-box protein [Okeania sp. SIO3I5]|uniref:PAS domain S-box protein n=1 Tax=Okeania sp. SIO3I5 TaxID=2607805 RepID=UPI0013BC2C50|nr:PAS domain S-box protein [Okeania sp. SIO3I5]NEQ41212.1 PAS domain S-box protein [Okeania sp. SIO3I5]